MVKQVYQASNSQNAIKKRESPQLNVRSNLDPIDPYTKILCLNPVKSS